jgi:hypothetical protein
LRERIIFGSHPDGPLGASSATLLFLSRAEAHGASTAIGDGDYAGGIPPKSNSGIGLSGGGEKERESARAIKAALFSGAFFLRSVVFKRK